MLDFVDAYAQTTKIEINWLSLLFKNKTKSTSIW